MPFCRPRRTWIPPRQWLLLGCCCCCSSAQLLPTLGLRRCRSEQVCPVSDYLPGRSTTTCNTPRTRVEGRNCRTVGHNLLTAQYQGYIQLEEAGRSAPAGSVTLTARFRFFFLLSSVTNAAVRPVAPLRDMVACSMAGTDASCGSCARCRSAGAGGLAPPLIPRAASGPGSSVTAAPMHPVG